MKNKFLWFACLLLTLLFSLYLLTSCGCDHADKDDNGFCDECGDEFEDGQDLQVPCQHRDADDNARCDKCNETFSDEKDVLEHAHSYIYKIITAKYSATPADCENAATYYYACACGDKSTDRFSFGKPLGHSYTAQSTESQYIATTADCENAATYHYSCSVCGDKGEETFPFGDPLGHNFSVQSIDSKYIATAADCENAATFHYSCVRCGGKGAKTFTHGEPLGHSYTAQSTESKYIATVADCKNAATFHYSCVRCGGKGAETFTHGEPLGHSYTAQSTESQYIATAADCKNAATYHYSCSICGDKGTKTFSYGEPKEHTIVIDKAIAPTCTETGLTEGKHCSSCKEVLVAQSVLPITHVYATTYHPKTCISEAYIEYRCGRCNDHKVTEVEPITADVKKTAYELTDGHFSSVTYTVQATGGYGNLQYKFYILQSKTNRTVMHESAYVSNNHYTVYTKDQSAMNDYVWGVIIKDTYGNAAQYELLIDDDSVLASHNKFVGTVAHSYENRSCTDCQKAEPAVQTYDISQNLDGSLLAKIYAAENGLYEMDIVGTGDMVYSSMPWYDYASLITTVNISEGVTSIGEDAFRNFIRLKSITIPDTVIHIKDYAFYGCSALQNVTIGKATTSIGNYAFDGCSALQSFILNATLLTNIGYDVFKNAATSGGMQVIIGAHIEQIPPLFQNANVASIEFEEGSICKSIADYAFNGCTALKSITIPDTVLTIGSHAFSSCSDLESITIGSEVTSIGSGAFYQCYALENIYFYAKCLNDFDNINSVFSDAGKDGAGIDVYFGRSVSKIPAYLFNSRASANSCPKIKNVYFEEGSVCTSIGTYAFGFCSYLESMAIPDKVTDICENAFYQCTSLTSITICDNVKVIGENAFFECSEIKTISIQSIESWCLVDFYDKYSNPLYSGNATLYVNGNALTDLTVPGTIATVNPYAFYNYQGLKSVTLEEGVVGLGYHSFDSCTQLSSVSLGTLSWIGEYAFANCSSLESIHIPESTNKIYSYAFGGCSSLNKVHLGYQGIWYFNPHDVTIGYNVSTYWQVDIADPTDVADWIKGTLSDGKWYYKQ